MPNDSTGGYILPATHPDEDSALDAVFQKAVVGITGLPGSMVRPRWQPVVPKQPEPSDDWCAIGVTLHKSQDGPYIRHNGEFNGTDTMIRHEDISILATFYGPNSNHYALMLRDGLYMPQNIEAFRVGGMVFVEAGDIRPVPELFNQQWIRRSDMPLRFRRAISRTYNIRNILLADVTFVNDDLGVIGTIHVTE